jgi:hypothetical protein
MTNVQNTFDFFSRGPTSLKTGIEKILVSAVLQMESNKEPLSIREGLELTNHVIKESIHQEHLIK